MVRPWARSASSSLTISTFHRRQAARAPVKKKLCDISIIRTKGEFNFSSIADPFFPFSPSEDLVKARFFLGIHVQLLAGHLPTVQDRTKHNILFCNVLLKLAVSFILLFFIINEDLKLAQPVYIQDGLTVISGGLTFVRPEYRMV